MDHDQNFKNLIVDYPRQALAFFAPEEARELAPDVRITAIRQEQLKDRLSDRFRELDIPFLVEWPDQRRELLLFVIEEETDPKRFSVHRLARYCLDLAELFETDRVVPVVVFLRGGSHPTELSLGGDRHTYLEFQYLGCTLPEIPFERFRDSDNLVARLNLPNMAFASDAKLAVYHAAFQGLLNLESDPERQAKYLDFVDLYAALSPEEMAEYQKRYPEEVEIMTTFAERHRQEGIEQGLEQGLERGMREGEAALLLRQIERKFGQQAAQVYRERIEAAETDTLLRWSERILTAETADQVFET